MTKKQKGIKVQKNTSLPWGTLLTLTVGAIIMSFVAWFGAQYYGTQMAKRSITNDARNWSALALDNLNNQERSFAMSKMSRGDQYIVKDFYNGTNMYRVLFLNAKGEIFWSSRPKEAGPYDKWDSLRKEQETGKIITKFSTVDHEKIVGLTLKAHNVLEKSYGVKTHDNHTIVETAIPVFANGKFAGSMVMFTDITGIMVWMRDQAALVATFLTAMTLGIFAIIAGMIWAYSTSRNKQSRQLHHAKIKSDRAGKEAREMADRLQEMNDDIAILNTDLNKNMKTLRETQDEVIRKGKMAQLGQLTATVAHDIRNPLGSVRTSAFLLRRKFAGDNPTMTKPLDRIENGVARCDGIITELLDFARTKDLNLKSQNFDDWLVNLVQETAEQLPQEVSFECNLGIGDKNNVFDADSIARAVINFMTNASEAMVGKGNDKPAVPTIDPKIAITTQLTNRGIEITVSDNGPGISQKNLGKILDPLFTTKSFGVGLGLPAVEKIFEKHRGGMEIKSTEGNGAFFTGWFPSDMEIDQPTPETQELENAG